MPDKPLRPEMAKLPMFEGMPKPNNGALLKKAIALADEHAGKKKSNADQELMSVAF